MTIEADSRPVLFFSNEAKPQLKVVTGLRSYIGGVGVALKLSLDFDCLALAIGPLSGAYPSGSEVAVAASGRINALMGDDSLNLRTKGIEGVVAKGFTLEELLPVLRDYLDKLTEKPLLPDDETSYSEIYDQLLKRVRAIWYKKGPSIWSCAGCPLACNKKFKVVPVIDLASLLGVCRSAAGIYDDLAIAFAALTALGYDYSHEELENGVKLVQELVNTLS